MIARVVTIESAVREDGRGHRQLPGAQRSVHGRSAGFPPRPLGVGRTTGRAMSVAFWENEADERASRANIAGFVERMADVLASGEVDQEICEVVHEPYPLTRTD